LQTLAERYGIRNQAMLTAWGDLGLKVRKQTHSAGKKVPPPPVL